MQVTLPAVAAFQAGHEGSIPFARSLRPLTFARSHFCNSGPLSGLTHSKINKLHNVACHRRMLPYVSKLTCWILMISAPSCSVTVYQIVTPSAGKCSSYAPGSG
jgi:hypothetical protein